MRELAEALAAFLVVVALIWAAVWWLTVRVPEARRQRLDPAYASELFGPLVSGFQVLHSRALHARDAESWDCTYAIIRLGDDAPAAPPSRVGRDIPWYERFGASWQATPARVPPCDTCRDALRFCARYWPGTGAALLRAVQQPGAWVSQDRIGETLDIWAPAAGLAAHIRFGD